jgi:hypothetical protein
MSAEDGRNMSFRNDHECIHKENGIPKYDFLAYFPFFEKIKGGLSDHLAVSVPPPH